MDIGSLSQEYSGHGVAFTPLLTSAKVKERIHLYLYPLTGSS
jgi:hypothetical protein